MKSDIGERMKNGRRRRLKLRHARYGAGKTRYNRKKAEADEKPTEISLHFCASSSSSSERSPESDVSAVLREDSLRENLNRDVPAWTARVAVSSHGCVSLIGRRREMEDAVRVELGFASRVPLGDWYDFFGVYDGHGGLHVAGECKERLHGIVKGRVEAAEGHVDWADVMAESFAEMDAEVVRTGDESIGTVGSTAVVAVVGREVVVVANCGDSRAVMSRGGSAIALSEDHKPNRPDEMRRIEAAGGRIINWNGHRILGVLATSRSIGDQYLKPFVTPEPEVTVTDRTDLDEFLILASDGLWDVVSNEYACQVVRRCLEAQVVRSIPDLQIGEESGAVVAASLLARLAMSRGSGDNISVIVVELNKRPRTPL